MAMNAPLAAVSCAKTPSLIDRVSKGLRMGLDHLGRRRALLPQATLLQSFHVAATDREIMNDHRSRPSNMSHQDLGVQDIKRFPNSLVAVQAA